MIRRDPSLESRVQHATPMMRQYYKAKESHPDAILFFRMGDFYEMFFEDAQRASELLGITLTARSKDKSGDKIPMAGIPVKSVDNYVRRLLEAGQRVAICEQLEDAQQAKGIVERGVVKVVTPGTFVDENVLDDRRALHLTAVVQEEDTLGLAWVDLSTGKFYVEDLVDPSRWEDAILRIDPAECVYPEGTPLDNAGPIGQIRDSHPQCALTPFPEWHFERETGRERLLAHFGTQSLEGFGCEHLGPAIRAAGALVHYLRETQRQALPHLMRLQAVTSHHTLRLDAATHRALELLEVARTGERRGSLLGFLDRTRTAMGARMLREWLCAPLVDRTSILERQQAVSRLVESPEIREEIRKTLRQVRDIERLASRLPLGRVNGRDLRALALSLETLPTLASKLEGFETPILTQLRQELLEPSLPELGSRLLEALVEEPPLTIKEGGLLRDGYEPELDELRVIGAEGVDWIAKFQRDEAERTGISTLKVGYNRVFGYYLEVTHTHRDKIPAEYVRKQTLKNAERYITETLKEYENKVLGAKERAVQLETELFQSLKEDVQSHLALLQGAADALARLDVLGSLAEVAEREGHVVPELSEDPVLEIEQGCHPVLAAGAGRADFTPNDVHLGGDQPRLAVITGPNMAGKSTYIRQAALLTILAQMGTYVPAGRAKIGIADRIFTRVGAADDLSRGQSTFMVEMTETANILNNATDRSLVILDEVGRGTSTLDGVSLAWAITEYLVERTAARALFATHYHELTELAERFPERVQNLNVAVKEWKDQIVFLHQIVPGGTDRSYGIHVARLAGLPRDALERAKEILAHLEQDHRANGAIPDSQPIPMGDGPRQLDLFGNAYEALDRRLREVPVDGTTPLEALQLLSELKKLLP